MTQSNQGINRRRFVVTAATQAKRAALVATALAAEGDPARKSGQTYSAADITCLFNSRREFTPPRLALRLYD